MTTATMHTTPLGLSVTEERIAELVAAGSSNREIAECLYLRRHTIEAHLTHISPSCASAPGSISQ